MKYQVTLFNGTRVVRSELFNSKNSITARKKFLLKHPYLRRKLFSKFYYYKLTSKRRLK